MTSSMAEWRDRGYVPDSDDEDEDNLGSLPKDRGQHANADRSQIYEGRGRPGERHIDDYRTPEDVYALPDVSREEFPSQPEIPKETFTKVKTPTPTTIEKLQAEIRRGLQTCKDALAPEIPSYLDEDDSPLSSLSSSPASGLLQLSQSGPTHQEVTEHTSPESLLTSPRGKRQAVPELVDELDGIPVDLYPTFHPRSSRSLRPRTLLQINPYSLEYAKYQQDCQRRGLAPVRLANFTTERAQANSQDTQGSTPFQSSERASSPIRVSSPLSSTRGEEEESQSRVRDVRHEKSGADSDDELPDVADILQGRVQALPTQKSKPRRRKEEVRKVQVKGKKPVFKSYDLPRQGVYIEEATGRQGSLFDIPPSPPRSGSVSSDVPFIYDDDDVTVFQTTPRPLPTPVLSSDRQSLKRKVIDVSSSSQKEHSGHDQTQQQSSPDTDKDKDSQGLMQIRRKIKGVLPASWLKLDVSRQTKKIMGQPKSNSPVEAAPLRGIATHVVSERMQGTHDTTGSRWLTFGSDAEDSSSSEAESHRQLPKPALEFDLADSDIDMDDVVVEDEIDRMEPPVSRPFRPRQSANKHQKRLSYVRSKSSLSKKHSDRAQQTRTFAPAKTRTKKITSKRVKRRHHAAQLSVLDAPGFRSASATARLQYLRIAARRQVSVQAPIPQNPARKFFRLATREDTVDLNVDLEAWRSGQLAKLRQMRESIRPGRAQVHQIQGVVEPGLDEYPVEVDFSATLDQLKLSTATTISKLRAQEVVSRPQAAPEAVAPTSRGSRRLPQILLSRPNQRVMALSNVPKWLGQLVSDPVVSFQPTVKHVFPIQIRASSTNLEQVLPTSSRSTAQGPVFKRRRKQAAPRLSRTDWTRLCDEQLPVSTPSKERTLNCSDAMNYDTDRDRALAIWAVEHLAVLDHQQPTRLSAVPSSHDVDVVAETIEDTFLKLFSWQSLPKTVLLIRSIWDGAEVKVNDNHLGNTICPKSTLVLVNKLLDGRARAEHKPNLDDALSSFTKSAYGSPTARLAATLLILWVLCSISRSAALPEESKFDGWSVLHPAINDFLAHHMISRGRDRTVYQSLGLTAVRICHMAVYKWHWQSADSVAKFWFKQYAENSMVELFVVPKLDQLQFRSQQTVLSRDLQLQDTDFDVFLKIAASLLETRTRTIGLSGGVGRTAGRIKSLVFSLSPNNSRELSDEQNLNVEDLVSMANIYALYEFLDEFAPSGARPRFSLVEKLIDFPKCHWNVCQFALRTWSRFTYKAIDCDGYDDLYTLGWWMKKTVMQMTAKIAAARAREAELRLSGIQLAVRENASRTWCNILELLQAWKAAVIKCPTATECKSLLNGGDIEDVLMICKNEGVDNNAIAVTICGIVQSYLDKSARNATDDFRSALHRHFRDILSNVLSFKRCPPSDHLKALADLWFNFARITVSHKQKNWDDFLSLPSAWSFGMLADSETSRQCQSLFMSEIMKHDTIHFELDRDPFYTTWIVGLVQPEQNFRFENELTKAFILHETENLSLDHLRSTFEDENGHLELNLSDLKHNRIEVLKNVIRNLYSLQFDDEDSQDFLGKPLNIHQGRNLLRLMTDTIKVQWRALSVDQRAPYTNFAKVIVTQLHIYKYKGFEIDPWFVDPGQLEFPKVVPFAENFLLPVNVPRPVLEEHLIRVFTSARLQAAGKHQEDVFVSDIASALSANTTTALDAEGNLALNTELQFEFMRKVLSVYVANVFTSPSYAFFVRTVIRALVSLVRDWHFRIDSSSEVIMQQMLSTAVEILSAARSALRGREVMQFVAKGAVGELIDQMLELVTSCTRRITMLEPLVEATKGNIQLVDRGSSHVIAVYEHMTGQNEDPGFPVDDQRGEESHMKGTVLEVLDEALHGTYDGRESVPAWRKDEPLASTWNAWLGTEDAVTAATKKHKNVLRKFEKALLDADFLEREFLTPDFCLVPSTGAPDCPL